VLQVSFEIPSLKLSDIPALGYSSGSGSATSRASNVSSTSSTLDNRHLHNHNCSLNGCLGAIPRNSSFRAHKSHSFRVRFVESHEKVAAENAFNQYRIEFLTCQIDCRRSRSIRKAAHRTAFRDTELHRQLTREFVSSEYLRHP
jgi:hypothetical protein